MNCRCTRLSEIEGQEANIYAKNHLQKIRVDGERWEIKYVCPETGIVWIMDFPKSHLQGGGPPRLRKITDSE
jgi:hypothetical protein